jgi:hypothetical protein
MNCVLFAPLRSCPRYSRRAFVALRGKSAPWFTNVVVTKPSSPEFPSFPGDGRKHRRRPADAFAWPLITRKRCEPILY